MCVSLAASALFLMTACGGGGGSSSAGTGGGAPSNLSYAQATITATEGTAIATDTPTVTGTVTQYSVLPALPTGLILNTSNGSISGSATETAAEASYVVTATNSAGHTTAPVQITVSAPSQVPAIASFTANQTTVASGVPTMLSWSETGASSLSIDNGVGTVSGSTWVVVYPAATTTYHLTAQNSAGTAPVQSVTVTVSGTHTYTDDFASTAALNAEDTTSVVGNDRVFMTSGETTATQVYKITAGTAVAGPAMANVHLNANAVVLPGGNQILVISGATSWDTSLVLTNSVDLITYNPGSDTWQAKAMNPLSQGRVEFTSTLLPDGRILIAGGQTVSTSATNAVTSEVEIYDPSANGGQGGTTVQGDLPVPMGYQKAVYANGLVYLVGGVTFTNGTPAIVPNVLIVNPATGITTQSTTTLPAGAGVWSGWSQLANGTCLMAGGMDLAKTPLLTSYRFNPAGNSGAGSFTATGNLNVARINPDTIALANGKVLVAGGAPHDHPYTDLSSGELFDPSGNGGAGTYALLGNSMVTGNECAPALLPNGSVLLPGGISGIDANDDNIDTSTAEIFN
jgi:hypothetical protein